MIKETQLRLEMTPQVLDKTGKKLFEIARGHHCGARFTGAGGGGCLWALGETLAIRGIERCLGSLPGNGSQWRSSDGPGR